MARRTREPEGSVDLRRRPRGSETVVMSSGARIRPRKLLRASSRCTVLNAPGAAVFLARTDERSGGRVGAPDPDVATTPSTEARFYRRLDTVVTVCGVALLGALGGFTLGERLHSSRTTALPVFSSSALSTIPLPLPDAVSSRAAEPSRPGSARSFVVPSFERPVAQVPFDPPWRDLAAMQQGNSPISAESFAALAFDNRRLDAEVVALEAEATSLELILLQRELQLFSVGLSIDDVTGFFDEEGTAIASEPPISAGDERLSDTTVYEETSPSEWIDDGPAELELFASELESEPLEASAMGDKALGAPQQRLVIAEVPPGGTVESVGLQPGDILLAIDGEEVFGIESLIAGIDGDLRRELYELTIARDGASFPLSYAGDLADLSLRLDWVDMVFTER